ncbi:beta-lactamase-like protein [Phycomyces nitens]|nr:beta-lactamase-like protein [Phycomyces nitens]
MYPPAPNHKSYQTTTRANDLYERHLYADAAAEYTKAIERALDGSRDYLALLYSNRSSSYLRIYNYKAALEDATRAIQLAPMWPKAYFRYADATAKLGDYKEAMDYYQKALEKDPENAKFISTRIAKTLIDQDNSSMGFTILQIISGRDICVERNFRNPIQNRIYEFANHMRNIIHVIVDNDTKQCVVVDACWDVDGILRIIDEHGYNLVAAIVTHSHFDHVGGSPPALFAFPIKISGLSTLLKRVPHIKAYVHSDDIDEILQHNPSIPPNRIAPTCTAVTETLAVGKTTLRFLHTPGHTPGSQSILIQESRLIAGDTLLCGLCGRTDLPGGNRKVMEHTLRYTLGKLDDRVVVYPGHHYGSEWSTIGIERDKGCLGEDLVGFGMHP